MLRFTFTYDIDGEKDMWRVLLVEANKCLGGNNKPAPLKSRMKSEHLVN